MLVGCIDADITLDMDKDGTGRMIIEMVAPDEMMNKLTQEEIAALEKEYEKVEIIEDRCILCGKCITACPQGAKKIDNDVSIIKEYIENPDIKVAISVAPSFVSVFKESRKNLVWALKQLGFDYVEETAVGAKYVTREYLRLLESGEMENIISSACPSVNMYIEKYYPSLTKYIAPVMSPALVHGKMLKESMARILR